MKGAAVDDLAPTVGDIISDYELNGTVVGNIISSTSSFDYRLLGSPFWEHDKEIFNLETSPGAEPWVYYTIYAFFVFLFNIFDVITDKMKARASLEVIGNNVGILDQGLIRLMGTSD